MRDFEVEFPCGKLPGGLGRVVSAFGEGVASAKAFATLPASADGTVFMDGVEHVLAACGVEFAVAGHEQAERASINPDHCGYQPSQG